MSGPPRPDAGGWWVAASVIGCVVFGVVLLLGAVDLVESEWTGPPWVPASVGFFLLAAGLGVAHVRLARRAPRLRLAGCAVLLLGWAAFCGLLVWLGRAVGIGPIAHWVLLGSAGLALLLALEALWTAITRPGPRDGRGVS